jgi:DNA-binding Xre family transcriptional regulator
MPLRPLHETIDEQMRKLNAGRKSSEPEYTYYRLARDLGVSHGGLWNIRNRNRSLNVETGGVLDKLCSALRCTPGDLLIYRKD